MPFIERGPPSQARNSLARRSLRPTNRFPDFTNTQNGLVVAANSSKTYSSKKGKSKKNKIWEKIFPLVQPPMFWGLFDKKTRKNRSSRYLSVISQIPRGRSQVMVILRKWPALSGMPLRGYLLKSVPTNSLPWHRVVDRWDNSQETM
ncbi:MAG: hypothetical protein CM15mV40_110 [Caudoviricetes sp.]|nr:MAG: hypothetical protein CM15mV40_110 [Caudoviricetes sp.]